MRHDHRLSEFRDEAEQELINIISFWQDHAVDLNNGGFIGRMNNANVIDSDAPKGSVLNARILWTFSAAYIYFKDQSHLDIAERAFNYICSFFIDPQFGGVYWTVDANGRPEETKKQVYASAFALYGVSEYYRASRNEHSLQHAKNLYHSIVEHAFDKEYGGFYEAFSRDWRPINDQRLSDKDANEKKSTNTNLHIVEAFANLYKVWPDKDLKTHIQQLLRIFLQKIIDPGKGHLRLFFDEQWRNKPALISYGHDVEAAWLLQQCAEIINDPGLLADLKISSLHLTNAAMNGLDMDGALWYEYNLQDEKLIREKHWWPQAEALVGFINAWQITGESRYSDAAFNSWEFIKRRLISPMGEWYWGIDVDGSIMQKDKVGLWKCPYHNSRACLELIKRIPR